MDVADRDRYEHSLKVYRDLKKTIDSSFDNGREEGREEERFLIAKNLKAAGVPVTIIQSTTGLSNKAINEL